MAVVALANISLPDCGCILVAAGWEPKAQSSMEIDASVFMMGAGGTVVNDDYFVFYGSQMSPNGSVRFIPSNSTGNPVDVQALALELVQIPTAVASINIYIKIYNRQARSQSFGNLKGVVAHIVEPTDDREVVRFSLPTAGMKETAITLKICRRSDQWKFRTIGQDFATSRLAFLVHQYGVDIVDKVPAPPPASGQKKEPMSPLASTLGRSILPRLPCGEIRSVRNPLKKRGAWLRGDYF